MNATIWPQIFIIANPIDRVRVALYMIRARCIGRHEEGKVMMKQIVFASVMTTLVMSAAHADDIAYATESTVLRSGPSTKDHVITRVPANAELSVEHCSQGWCRAQLGSKSGYVALSMLDFNDAPVGSHSATVIERTYIEPTYVYPGYYPGPYFYGPGIYFGAGYHHHWRH
jgi:uncharacterized protein YraI